MNYGTERLILVVIPLVYSSLNIMFYLLIYDFSPQILFQYLE